ncbi:hypothetical protein Ddc_19297 [Ditylenchus destructor]|nr:hypothetical protein Ddc_19297 [Ditylenchus destructor]
MDNGTMVEAFKYLNYCQLAKNSLVSMRFRNVIQTHRHKLALLFVSRIDIFSITNISRVIRVFDKKLSSEAYNDWVICNQYSKEVPLEDQVACTESTQDIPNGYCLSAYAHYKDPNHREQRNVTTVFFARAELNHENWPLFQHFVRLATDPFIYIEWMELTYQNAVLNSLSKAINTNRRLQCKTLYFDFKGDSQKSLTWTKNHVRCNQLRTYGEVDLNQDKALFDFFVTGGHCTSAIEVGSFAGSSVGNFVQKFMDLKHSDESRLVDDIKGSFYDQDVESLKRNYAKFVVKEERDEHSAEQIFEFANNDIGKKLQLTATNRGDYWSNFSIKIDNL